MKDAHPFMKVLDKVTFVLSRISSVLLIVAFLLVAVNVVGRKVFNMPVRGSVELIEYIMLIAMSLAVSRTGFEDRHVSVTLIHEMLPQKVRAVLKSLCELVGGVTFGSLVFKYAKSVPAAIDSGRVSDVWHIPYTVVYIFLTIAMSIVALTFFYQSWLAIYKGFRAGDGEETEGSGS